MSIRGLKEWEHHFITAPSYRKVALVKAIVADEDGEIDTPEGIMSYSAGDYLVIDQPPTHIWPVKKDIFEVTHRQIGEEPW